MQMVRTDLRAATDAAAKAGAAALARDRDSSSAIQAAIDLAAANTVGGRPLVLTAEDIEVGQATRQPDGSWAFSTGEVQTAVRVTAQMSDLKSTGAVPLFFGSLFGIREFTPQRTSTASYFDQEICLVIDRSHSMCFDLTGSPGATRPPSRRIRTKSRILLTAKRAAGRHSKGQSICFSPSPATFHPHRESPW